MVGPTGLCVRLLIIFGTASLVFSQSSQSGTCSSTSPCQQGCCGKSGYCGFGPSYCGAGNCTSNCNAQAECGQYAPSNQTLCPLNVCCSKYGFCGTTSDFCGDGCQSGCAPVPEPSCGGTSSQQRRIGYYESWSPSRPCDVWQPETINPFAWTHINYAFGLIDSNFHLAQMNSWDTDFYVRFVNLKMKNPNLKLFISVGGWDAGGAIFSQMTSTEGNRQAFISSALSFLATYGFDGIDIDWEYPAAADRQGVPADTQNFVTFMRELKTAMGSQYGLSVTIPTSYWYMKGFDIVGLERWTDWFNFMAYDIHGTWDGKNPYTQAVVQPHTNLTEIKLGLDLLWRNNINPAHVVLGEGFYGRSFTLTNPSCNTPGCAFSGGGNPGNCTGTSGILSDAEIARIIRANNLQPQFDATAAIKWITWNNNQWVSYDDNQTFALKTAFANAKCLSGIMAWALDLDDPKTQVTTFNLIQPGLSINDQGMSFPNTMSKIALRGVANSVANLFFWTPCDLNPEEVCPAGTRAIAAANGRVYDGEKELFGGYAPCHGGPGGYGRALCAQNNIITDQCMWYGVPSSCIGDCPYGYIEITQNTGPSLFGNIQCPPGRYSKFCCKNIFYSADPLSCLLGGLDSILSGGLAPRLANNDNLLLPPLANKAANNPGCAGCDGVQQCAGLNCIGCPNCGPTSSSTPPPTTTSSATLQPRGQPWNTVFQCYSQSLLGADILNVEGYFSSNVFVQPTHRIPAVTVTTTATSKSYTFTTTSRTCDGATYPDACLHYHSVCSNTPEYSTLLCPAVRREGRDRPAVTRYKNQHWAYEGVTNWIYGWTQVPPANNYGGPGDHCDCDEWPPFVFWSTKLGGQWIRLLSRAQNQLVPNFGSGKWSDICSPSLTASRTITSYQRPCQEVISNTFYSCTDYHTEVYPWPMMAYDFTNLPNYADDGLIQNFCYPQTLVNDPGFALYTDDKWYSKNNKNGKYNSAQYAESPSATIYQGKKMPTLQVAKRNFDPFWDPEDIVIDQGNSSRKPTDEELWREYGFIRCESEDCIEEEKRLDAPLRRPEPELVHPREVEVIVSTVSAGHAQQLASPLPGSNLQSPQTSEATPTAKPGHINRHIHRHHHA